MPYLLNGFSYEHRVEVASAISFPPRYFGPMRGLPLKLSFPAVTFRKKWVHELSIVGIGSRCWLFGTWDEVPESRPSFCKGLS